MSADHDPLVLRGGFFTVNLKIASDRVAIADAIQFQSMSEAELFDAVDVLGMFFEMFGPYRARFQRSAVLTFIVDKLRRGVTAGALTAIMGEVALTYRRELVGAGLTDPCGFVMKRIEAECAAFLRFAREAE